MPKTNYVILEEFTYEGGIEGWTVFSENVQATSAISALRTALNGQGNLGTNYVAVPERSWKPQPVAVETQHRIKIG